MCEETFQNLLKSSLSFADAYKGSNEEKNGEAAEGRGSMWNMENSPGSASENLSEYFGHAWLGFNTKLQKYTLSA